MASSSPPRRPTKRPRISSSSPAPTFTDNDKKAVATISRFWVCHGKDNTLMLFARRFCQQGPSLQQARAILFEDLSARLREDEVINCTVDFLFRIIQLCNWRRGQQPLITGTVNAKIFLASFMIAARPHHVFETIGDLEQKVMDASEPMIECFHNTATALASKQTWPEVKKDAAKHLCARLCQYLRTFKEWKISDEKKLAGRLQHALTGLENAEKAMCEEDGEDSMMKEELQRQQESLKAKMGQIAGAQKTTEEEGEGQGDGGSSSSASARRRGAGVLAATVARTVGSNSGGGAGGSSSSRSSTKGMSNLQLAHEMMLDADFKLDEQAGMSQEKLVHTKIRETFERAFWESLSEDVNSDPPRYARVLSVLVEIRTGVETVACGHAEAEKISTIIDIDQIKDNLSNGVLDYRGCEELLSAIFSVILDIHTRMRSPTRRDETELKWEEQRAKMLQAYQDGRRVDQGRALCEALELALDRIHTIRVDSANGKLKAISPVVRKHGVEYQQSHFQKMLDSGEITLDGTKLWLGHTAEGMLSDANDDRVTLEGLKAGVGREFENLVHAAAVDLVADYPCWGGNKDRVPTGQPEKDLPETMMLDQLRIQALNAFFHTSVISAIIIITAESEIRKQIRDAPKCKAAVGAVQQVVATQPPKPKDPSATIQLVLDKLRSDHGIIDNGLDKGLTTLANLLCKNVERSNAIYVHMVKTFKIGWFYLLKGLPFPVNRLSESCRAVIIHETENHVASLGSILLLNKKVHVKRYNECIKEVVKDVEGEAGAVAAARPFGM